MERIDLKAFRKSHHLTQQDVAKELGVSTSFIGQIETGRRKLPEDAQEKLLMKYADTPTPANEDVTIVPLLPVYVKGGSIQDFSASVMEHECERLISPVKDAEMAITVSGDSMAPEFPSGSYVFVKKINSRAFIEWGRTYVLDTVNGSIIKKVLPGPSEDRVICSSVNPDYRDFEVQLQDVFGMYRVLLMMALK